MKRFLQLSAAAFLLDLVACGPTKEQAIEFNDSVVADQKDALSLAENMMASIYDWDYDQAEGDFEDFQSGIGEMLKKYEEMSAFDKEDEFRLAMIDLLKVMEGTFETFEEILGIIDDNPDLATLSDDDASDIEDELDAIFEEIDAENKDFLAVQEKFAEKYDFRLE